MKYCPLVVLFILGLGGCKESGIDSAQIEEDTVKIDSNHCDCNVLTFDKDYNHFYRFERRKPYTGKCEAFYPDGTLKLEKNFVEGKVHGKMISYHDNGQVHEEQEFKMNLQTGERIIYTKSGKVKFHALYKNGKQIELIESNPMLELDD
ncbi:MAG: hypothetical protein WDZ35_04100 [Crocinitomicaceae bacterium]